jgi:hypothetical protein
MVVRAVSAQFAKNSYGLRSLGTNKREYKGQV